jgi:hypothetical protein
MHREAKSAKAIFDRAVEILNGVVIVQRPAGEKCSA